MHKYKIVNWKRLSISIFVLLLLIAFMIILISKESLSCTEIKYKTVEAISGDTLWSIAEEQQLYNEYYYQKDIRDIISSLKQINGLENSNLHIGQIINVPYI